MPSANKPQSLLRWITSNGRSSFAFAVCLTAILLAYRMELTLGLFRSTVRPFDFNPGSHPAGFILTSFPYDLALIFTLSLLSWLFSRGCSLFDNRRMATFLKISGWISYHLVILVFLIIHAAHIRLLFNAQTGLDMAMIKEVWINIPIPELLKFITMKGAILLLFPVAIFWVIVLLPTDYRLWMARGFLAILLFLLSLWGFAPPENGKTIPSEIRLPPPCFSFPIWWNGLFPDPFLRTGKPLLSCRPGRASRGRITMFPV